MGISCCLRQIAVFGDGNREFVLTLGNYLLNCIYTVKHYILRVNPTISGVKIVSYDMIEFTGGTRNAFCYLRKIQRYLCQSERKKSCSFKEIKE